MPRKYPVKTHPEPDNKLVRGVTKRFEDFARASDAVELLDPTGTWIEVPVDRTFHRTQALVQNGPPKCKITEYGCKVIQFYAQNSLSVGMIAERLGMGTTSLNRCIREQPEVAAAIAAGQKEGEYELTDCLMNMARRGNVVAAIFLLKAKHGWRDNDPPPEARPAVQVVINAPLTAEQYKELRENNVTPLQLPPPRLQQTIDTVAEEAYARN